MVRILRDRINEIDWTKTKTNELLLPILDNSVNPAYLSRALN
jgi:hypothetical protein